MKKAKQMLYAPLSIGNMSGQTHKHAEGTQYVLSHLDEKGSGLSIVQWLRVWALKRQCVAIYQLVDLRQFTVPLLTTMRVIHSGAS